MKKVFYIGLSVVFSVSVAQAQQSVDSRTSNKAPESKSQPRLESQPLLDSKIESVEKDRMERPRVSTSASQSDARQKERATRQRLEPAKSMEYKSYDRMTDEERNARIYELERIMKQNEGNPDFNREAYQKRLDMLQSPDKR